MPISLYQASIPPMILALNNLQHVLGKALAHTEAHKIDPSVLVNFRLYPDMLPLRSQIQIASDIAKGGAARLAGLDIPKFDDGEITLQDLQARLQKTLDFIATCTPEHIDGQEARAIVLVMRDRTVNTEALPYLQRFVLPNLYFHSAIAYGILRHNGVELGKRDFLGPIFP